VFQIDVFILSLWGIVTFCIMSAVAIIYNLAKKMAKPTPKISLSTLSTVKEYFITIDVNDAILSYNQAKSDFDSMKYKSSIFYCHSAVRDVLSKTLNYLNVQFAQDLNIVDMSSLIQSRGVRLSLVETARHINSIRLRSMQDQPVSKEEVLWMLLASKEIINACKELPVTVYS